MRRRERDPLAPLTIERDLLTLLHHVAADGASAGHLIELSEHPEAEVVEALERLTADGEVEYDSSKGMYASADAPGLTGRR